jgi:malonyl CoA-acyl carrier protein transacylase
MRALATAGVTRCIEVGPGGVLTGLLKNIDASLAGSKFGEAADWERLAAAVSV